MEHVSLEGRGQGESSVVWHAFSVVPGRGGRGRGVQGVVVVVIVVAAVAALLPAHNTTHSTGISLMTTTIRGAHERRYPFLAFKLFQHFCSC